MDVKYDHLVLLEREEGLDHTYRPENADRKYSVRELLEGVRDDATRGHRPPAALHKETASDDIKAAVEVLPPVVVVEPAAGVDLLVVTALTEEAQVVHALLSQVATRGETRGEVTSADYRLGNETVLRVATASAHRMGAVDMGVFTASLLGRLRPRSATLVGIAAAVDPGVVSLGDVPFSSHVVSYDDLAAERDGFSPRSRGYPVDPAMLHAVGELRTSADAYRPWQDDCLKAIRKIIPQVNALRRREITPPKPVRRPHLVVEVTAGGPLLLRYVALRDTGRGDAVTRRA